MAQETWGDKAYARMLIDNHITEDDPSFMRGFDPQDYVAKVKRAGVDAAMVYACCHNGNCYYPTKVGHMHGNLDGRDIFGETVALLRQENIATIGYTSVIFHNQAAKDYPEWRVSDQHGRYRDGRYWLCCPNNEAYTQFACQQVAEINEYDVDGVFVDMVFWPGICLCDACRDKYMNQTGKTIPETINWRDSDWVRFHRFREASMAEFAQKLRNTVKQAAPERTFVYNFAPALIGWFLGSSSELAQTADYTSGDFYGGVSQQRFGTKVLAAYSRQQPYEFMTSRCVTLYDHTSMKSEAEMVCSAATTLANGGAYFFIDAINPDGTLYDATYAQLGRVSQQLKPFRRALVKHQPRLVGDTGLYYSMKSLVNEQNNGMRLDELTDTISNMDQVRDIRPLNEMVGASMVLNQAQQLYRIVREDMTDLSAFDTLILNNALYMSADEVIRIRDFVADGGTLIATGMSSYASENGESTGDFTLADVFGVSYTGKDTDRMNYLVINASDEIVSCDAVAPFVTATTAEVLGYVANPYFPPDNIDQYASIHSNPPGPVTEYAGLTVNKYGKGTCVYLYSSIGAMQQSAQQEFLKKLLMKYRHSDVIVDCTAPVCVEVTLLKSTTATANLLCFVNYQQDQPNVPVHHVECTLRLPDNITVQACQFASTGAAANWQDKDGSIHLTIEQLDIIEMIEITYKKDKP